MSKVSGRIIQSDEFGQISFVKSKKARNIRITIRPFHGIKVSLPWFVSYDAAEKVLMQKENWIRRSFLKVKKLEGVYTIFGPTTIFHTRFHKLEVVCSDREKIYVRVARGVIKVLAPGNGAIENPQAQEKIRKGIEKAWKVEAEDMLLPRVYELAVKYNFKYKRVVIKNAKSRWGSCSGDNVINLSLHLMRLPDHLIDYIILHELCHTVQKNHGPHFWGLLENVTGNARLLAKELHNYRAGVY